MKLLASTVHSTDAEKVPAESIGKCVLDNVSQWEWPNLPVPAPYMGSINFKPAW